MPQMFQYCGQQFRIYKRAHKTCDTITGIWPNNTSGRGLSRAVHLELRCDGKAHGGCQAACLIFWKEAWLGPSKRTNDSVGKPARDAQLNRHPVNDVSCMEQDVWKATRANHSDDDLRYVCQATQVLHFTEPLRWWDVRQYLEDYTSGNAALSSMVRGFVFSLVWHLGQARRQKIGRPTRWLYDRFQAFYGGVPYSTEAGNDRGRSTDPNVRSKSSAGRTSPCKILR